MIHLTKIVVMILVMILVMIPLICHIDLDQFVLVVVPFELSKLVGNMVF